MKTHVLKFLIVCTILFSPANLYAQDAQGYYGLHDVFKMVYQTNPLLLAAREELEETRELYPQARAGWLPSVNAEAGIYSSDIKNSNFGNSDGTTTKEMALNVDQPIWRGGRTFAETDRAQSLIRAGEMLLREAEQDILLDAATLYMDVIRDRELLNLRRENEKILLRELDAAWERQKIGDITKTDVEQARTRLSRAVSDTVTAARNLDISRAQFEETVGEVPPEKLMIPYTDFRFPSSLDDMVIMAESQNPELQNAKFEHRASEHDIKAKFRELLPQVSAYASVNHQYDPQPGIVDKTETETIGLRATLALYQGGAIRSRVREARRAEKRHQHEIEGTRRRIRQEAISNWRSYSAAQTEIKTRMEEIEAAEHALKGVREEHKVGQRTVLDVLDADQDVIDARAALVNAHRNEAVSKYNLAATLGILQPDIMDIRHETGEPAASPVTE